ncbi:MAG: sulfotransferase [Xenococcus sp. (in: cyanobacteria)]
MKLPNFLIIGAAKGGTTSLYHYLSQHPQIYMSSLKEPRFFALEGEKLNFQNPDSAINYTSVTTLSEYCKLFEGVRDEIAIGEASPLYLYSTKAIERIAHYLPKAKLIVILRNPVDRAYSCYKHLVALEPFSFADALQEEDKRISQNWSHLWHYRQGGYYYKQLKGYFEKFSPEQIKVYLFDDLKSDPLGLVQNLFSVLEVDDSFVPDLAYRNVSNNPKIKVLQNIVSGRHFLRLASQKVVPASLRKNVAQKIRSWNSQNFEAMPEEVRYQLTKDYREDILKLQDLVGLNLSHWLC